MIDLLKEKYKNKPKTENEDKKKIEVKKAEDSQINNEEILHKTSMKKSKKRKSQDSLNDIIKNMHKNSIKNINIEKKDENTLSKIHNLYKINKFLLEFIHDNNIIEKKRSNSMTNLFPKSQTVNSKTTCDTSIDDLFENKDKNKKINTITNNNNSNINDEEGKNIYENIYLEKEAKITEKKQEKFLVNKSATVLREMNEMSPIYKEQEENENSIKFKQPENKLALIHTDIFLKKIIFEDFLNNNILLVYHFCQQCFCFINKEIFFKKLLDCYRFYKKKMPIENLGNLIEFYNVLIIEMFCYYQKIDLSDVYIKDIKTFYIELMIDLISSLKTEKETKNENDNTDNPNKINDNNSNDNAINKGDLINMNLNIDPKEMQIFDFEEYEKVIQKEDNKDIKRIGSMKSLSRSANSETKRLSFEKNTNSSFILNKNDSNEEINDKTQNTSLSNKVLPFKKGNKMIIENDKDEGSELELSIEEENKPQLFYISNKLVSSPTKKFKDEIIEEENHKEKKSDDEKEKEKALSNESLYSDKSDSDSNSDKSSFSRKDSIKGNDKNEEKTINLLNKNIIKRYSEKEEDFSLKFKKIKNILELSQISENLMKVNEKILIVIKFILPLFEKVKNGEPKNEEMNEAKKNISYYRKLNNLMAKIEKNHILILPFQKHKRFTQRCSLFFFGQSTSKQKVEPKGYFCVNDWKTEDIGDTLISISKSLLNKIHPRELYRAVFIKKNKDITSPNLVECINKSIRLTHFIIEDIISYYSNRERAKAYEKWVQIAEYCRLNKDYNDLFAIFTALHNYIITGLNETQKNISSKCNNMFKHIMDFCTLEGNYRLIREDINKCEKKGEIFVPHPAILMKDINYFEESSKYINEKGCINFEKIENISEILEKHFKYKKKETKYQIKKELKFFENLDFLTEDELEEIEKNVEQDKLSTIAKRLTSIDIKYFEKEAKNPSHNFNVRGSYMPQRIINLSP